MSKIVRSKECQSCGKVTPGTGRRCQDCRELFTADGRPYYPFCEVCKKSKRKSLSKRCRTCRYAHYSPEDGNTFASRYPDLAEYFCEDSPKSASQVSPHSKDQIHAYCMNCGKARKTSVFKFARTPLCGKCSHRVFSDPLPIPSFVVERITADSPHQPQDLKLWSDVVSLRLDCGHIWTDPVANVVDRKFACPFCSRYKLLQGFNDFATTHKKLASKVSTNSKLDATQVLSGTNKLLLFICDKCRGEFLRRPYVLTMEGRLSNEIFCDDCYTNRFHEGEDELEDFLTKLTEASVEKNCRTLIRNPSTSRPLELDFYMPTLGRAVEANGELTHSDHRLRPSKGMSAESYHQLKVDLCRAENVDLCFVWWTDWKRSRSEVEAALEEFIRSGVKAPVLDRKVSRVDERLAAKRLKLERV